jgi:hypothetical protein
MDFVNEAVPYRSFHIERERSSLGTSFRRPPGLEGARVAFWTKPFVAHRLTRGQSLTAALCGPKDPVWAVCARAGSLRAREYRSVARRIEHTGA